MQEKIQVVLIEDNPDYRDVVRLALECERDLQLAAQFGTSEMALKQLSDTRNNLQVDVILLDLRLPGMDGVETLKRLSRDVPHARVIVLTQSDQESDVVNAIRNGAAGYILKSSTVDQLTDSIRSVCDGGSPLDPSVARFLLQAFQSSSRRGKDEQNLSSRELEVLTLLAQGLVKKQIAVQLAISYTTVDTHVGRIYTKLKVNNAPAAVNEAHRRKLFPSG